MEINDTVFVRDAGDVRAYKIIGIREYKGSKIYDLKADGVELFNVVEDKSYGKRFYDNKSDAISAAIDFIKTHDCLISSKLKFVEEECFSYKYFGEDKVAFFGIMPNGYLYIDDFMVFTHVINCGSVEKARKYISGYKDKIGKTEPCSEKPKLKTLYRCKDDSKKYKWIYSASGYCGVIK